MKKVLIESPYAGDIERNMEYARRCMKDSLGRHEAPFLSHVLYANSGALDDSDPEERALGITAGLIWGEMADFTAVYCDYGISPGMWIGIRNAFGCKRRVIFREIGKNA